MYTHNIYIYICINNTIVVMCVVAQAAQAAQAHSRFNNKQRHNKYS